MKKWLLFTLLFISTACFAQPSDELLKRAQAGDEESQYKLGYMYYEGDGTPQDFEKAKQWFEKVAAQNNAQAQHALGLIYFFGKGVPIDYVQAREWFEKAAEQNNLSAQIILRRVEPIASLQQAAQEGNAQAQNNLGIKYLEGAKDIPQDLTLALMWLKKAAAQGHKNAQETLEYFEPLTTLHDAAQQGDAQAQYKMGMAYWGIPPTFLGLKHSINYDKAKQWLEKSAIQNNAEAQLMLGVLYFHGLGTPQDLAKAKEWFEKASTQPQGDERVQNALKKLEQFTSLVQTAEQGDAQAQYLLGMKYHEGKDVAQNLMLAFEWLNKSAQQGNADAQFQLGENAYNNYDAFFPTADLAKLIPIYRKNMISWFLQAAEQRHAKALERLGDIYDSGKGVPRNRTLAIQWYEKASEQGNAEASEKLGDIYRFGKGVPKDIALAIQWYEKSAEQGNGKAQGLLGFIYLRGEDVKQDLEKSSYWFTQSCNNGVPDMCRHITPSK